MGQFSKASFFTVVLLCCHLQAADWLQTASLPDRSKGHSLLSIAGYLYQVGGANGGDQGLTTVLYAQAQSGGVINGWAATTPLPEAVFFHAGVAANGYIYVLGGQHYTPQDGELTTNVVYYAKANPDGTLGIWQIGTPLPQVNQSPAAAVWNNRIYVIGGNNSGPIATAVYSAVIQPDGSISSWTTQRALPHPLWGHCALANGTLYVLGGQYDTTHGTNSVYTAHINADGSLAPWLQTTPLPQAINAFAAVISGGAAMVFAGRGDLGTTAAFYSAIIAGDGSLGAWSTQPVVPQPLYSHAVCVAGGSLFLTGGVNSQAQKTVYSFPLSSSPSSPAPPTLLATGLNSNHLFQVQLTSQPGYTFGVFSSSNLANWLPLGSTVTDSNGQSLFLDTNTAPLMKRFYRAVWQAP